MKNKTTIAFAPPESLDVLDSHGGFTAVTKRGTLWRSKSILRGRSPIGKLLSVCSEDFFQNNNNVISALYCLKGYSYLVKVWFDRDGTRIA